MRRSTLALPFALVLAVLPLSLSAQAGGGGRPVAMVTPRRVEVPPIIDGGRNDEAWAGAVPVSDFWQFQPDEGGQVGQTTEFRIAYDDSNLYVLVHAIDAHPDSILHALSRRDADPPSDQIGVMIDSYHDSRSGYEFAVNPDGVKRDNTLYNDGQKDYSWDGVWDVATSIDESGWTAEYRIPLSQLRYPSGANNTFGIGVYREIRRYNQTVAWPRLSRDRPGIASQLAAVDGFVGLGSARAAELTPYMVAKSETEPRADGRFRQAEGVTVGSDVKLKLTPNFTVDATVNPDFGQVEADPAVLNLDAFETFLGEKRPFFLEGTALYRFSLNCSVVNCSSESLIYSRRIGRSPELRSKYGDATTPTGTPIAAAAKITGQTLGGLSFGGLSAVTRRVEGLDDRTVEPLTNRAALVVDQNLRGGLGGLRLTATAVNRSLDEWTAPFMHESAYSAAFSARERFGAGDNFEITSWLAASRVAGSPEALLLTQKGAVHYFQQPGDESIVDPTRTSLGGTAFQVTIGKNGGGITRFQSSLIRQSAGFEVNDLGYQRRSDFMDWSTWGALNFNTPTRLYRNLSWNGNVWRHWTTSGRPIQMAVNSNAHLFLHNNWSLHGGFTLDRLGATYCDRCTRGGPLLRWSRSFNPWFAIDGDNRRKIVPHLNTNLTLTDEGRTRAVNLSPNLELRFSTRLDGRIGMNIGAFDNETQWIDNVTAGETTHYVFAHMDQRTVSAQVRLNYTAAPNLTLQFYGEPFVSRGDYSDFRETSGTPEAARYDDRFVPYADVSSLATGFHFRQLRTNTVVRWEYLPGSTLFVAWAHGRQASGGPTDLSWGEELDDLFGQRADNTFLIKVAHWLAF